MNEHHPRPSPEDTPRESTDTSKVERYVRLGVNENDARDIVALEQTAAERRETHRPPHPRIYVRSTIDHREGHEIGDWIDAAQHVDGLTADILAVLSRSLHTARTSEPVEQWEIGSSDDFEFAERSDHESLDVVSALGKGAAEHGLAFSAWAGINQQLQGRYDIPIMQRFSEAYIGDFASVQTYAEHLVIGRGGLEALDQLPDWLQRIMRFDWTEMIRELEWSGELQIVDHDNGIWVFDGRLIPTATDTQDTKGGDE